MPHSLTPGLCFSAASACAPFSTALASFLRFLQAQLRGSRESVPVTPLAQGLLSPWCLWRAVRLCSRGDYRPEPPLEPWMDPGGEVAGPWVPARRPLRPPPLCPQPEGNILRDRFKSFQKRNMIEPRERAK